MTFESEILVRCRNQKQNNVKLAAKNYFVLIKKDIWMLKMKLHQWSLQNIIENEARFTVANFNEIGSAKGIVTLVAEILNISKSLLATGNWSKEKGGIGWSKLG